MSLLFILCDEIGRVHIVSLLIPGLAQFYYCVHTLFIESCLWAFVTISIIISIFNSENFSLLVHYTSTYAVYKHFIMYAYVVVNFAKVNSETDVQIYF